MQRNGKDFHPLNSQGGSPIDRVKRAFGDFLLLPTLIVLALLLAAVGAYLIDRAQALSPLHGFLQTYLFTNSDTTAAFVATAAGGLLTVTSIVISMLLIILQQTATNMSERVFNQFLYRRGNQVFFGFFVGVTAYAVLTTALQNQALNSVFGAALLLVLIIAVLYMLVILLYSSINQMRPETIISAVHKHTLAARLNQLDLIKRTLASPQYPGGARAEVHTGQDGYVTRLKLDRLAELIHSTGCPTEVTLRFSIGSFVGFDDVIAEVRAETGAAAQQVAEAFPHCIRIEQQRDIHYDAAYGIEQLEMIGWTSISSAKSDPVPGILVIHSLRDLIARFSQYGLYPEKEQALPVVYPDNVPKKLFDAIEALAVASSESMQPQSIDEIIHALAVLYARLDENSQRRVDDLTLRLLSLLGDHVLTAELDASLKIYIHTLEQAGKLQVAANVSQARQQLEQSVGRLSSRSTRAPDFND